MKFTLKGKISLRVLTVLIQVLFHQQQARHFPGFVLEAGLYVLVDHLALRRELEALDAFEGIPDQIFGDLLAMLEGGASGSLVVPIGGAATGADEHVFRLGLGGWVFELVAAARRAT